MAAAQPCDFANADTAVRTKARCQTPVVSVRDTRAGEREESHRRPQPTCSYASRIQPANSSSIDETRK
jgi:hypothetical protein